MLIEQKNAFIGANVDRNVPYLPITEFVVSNTWVDEFRRERRFEQSEVATMTLSMGCCYVWWASLSEAEVMSWFCDLVYSHGFISKDVHKQALFQMGRIIELESLRKDLLRRFDEDLIMNEFLNKYYC